jgi:amicyanin
MPQMPGYAPAYPQDAPLPQSQVQPQPPSPAADDRVAMGDATVTIRQMQFNPPWIVVKQGSTVNWQQADRMTHDVRATDRSFASPRLRQGTTFSQTFDKPGTYDYYCSLHPQMRGQVVVVER